MRAEQAEAAWRLDAALEAWSAIKERAPAFVRSHRAQARVLARLGREPEAITVLKAAVARFPQSPTVALDLARVMVQTAAFADALVLCRDIVARFPGHPLGFEITAKALRGLGRFDEADAVIDDARARLPFDLGLAVESAVNADVRGDWAAMLERSQRMLGQFPDAALAHACTGGALKKLNRFDEADALLTRALTKFPRDSNIAMNHAWVADHRGDHDEGLRRWTATNARFGQEPRVRAGYLESLAHHKMAKLDAGSAGDDAPGASAPAGSPGALAPGATPHTALLGHFQSLGANCEFGFVQRHFGAEPIGLLRWAGIAYDKLLVGLDSAFDGVGSAERTRIGVNASNQEYYVDDTVYGLGMHTATLETAARKDDLHAKMCRRLTFLRDKLLDDLTTADKTFVFHSGEPFGDDEARQLHHAIRRHGAGRLLFVRIARAGERAGEVVPLEHGLAVGLIDRTGLRNNHWNISFDCWLRLCQSADALLKPV